jgi:hypothetical protein
MREGDAGPPTSDRVGRRPSPRADAADVDAEPDAPAAIPPGPGCILETVVSPFHCLYQDALEFHKQAHLRLPRSEAEASRLARAALLLYLASAEALVHQAAAELGRPELTRPLCDPDRPVPLRLACRLLPALAAEPGAPPLASFDPDAPPWPQFDELLELRASWAYPGDEPSRRAYYRQRPDEPGGFEPLEPHQVPAGLDVPSGRLASPLTGLPRDPYALRPRHLDTARGVLDAAVAALDRRLGGALTQGARHRREPVRIVHPG